MFFHANGKDTGARMMTLFETFSCWDADDSDDGSVYRISLAIPCADIGDDGNNDTVGDDADDTCAAGMVHNVKISPRDAPWSTIVSRSHTTACTNTSSCRMTYFQRSRGDCNDDDDDDDDDDIVVVGVVVLVEEDGICAGIVAAIAFFSLIRNCIGNEDIRDTGTIAPAITVSGASSVRTVNTITSRVVGRRSDLGYFKYSKPKTVLVVHL
jgi:hypothetical protein